MIKRILVCVAFLLLASALATEARIHRGGLGGSASSNTCPQGLVWAAFDGCQGATPGALFQDTSLNTHYIMDASGNPATLAHPPGVDYNEAGQAFAVGPKPPFVYTDPAGMSFTSTGNSVSTSGGVTTITFGTVTQGVITNGMTIFPGAGGTPTGHPTISACTGSGSGAQCTSSAVIGSISATIHGSFVAPCFWTNGGASTSSWTCTYRFPNQQLSTLFDHVEFAAVGGHTASSLRVSDQDNGFFTLSFDSNHFATNAAMNAAQAPFINTLTGVNGHLNFVNNECDGGNASVPVGEPNPANFVAPKQQSCLSWGGRGVTGGLVNAGNILFAYNYIHDWAGDETQIDTAYNCITEQANVFINNGSNNGNNVAGGQTGAHGADINYNTTATGAQNYCKNVWNHVSVYPYGFRNGVTTGPLADLGGIASAIENVHNDYEVNTIILNISSSAGHAIAEFSGPDIFRTGKVDLLTAHHNFFSNIGASNCMNVGGDVQTSGSGTWGGTGSSVSNGAGTGLSIWTVSGVGAGVPIPFPGQPISNAATSQTPTFIASQTDLGNGTSSFDITTLLVGSSSNLYVGAPVVALNLSDWTTHPTIVTAAGSGDLHWIVSNGTGSGETQASQVYMRGYSIYPFGTGGTTATGGTNPSNYNGTYQIAGEITLPASHSWQALSAPIGNIATLATDVSDNWDMLTAGSAGAIDISKGGPNLSNALNVGGCPNTSPV